MFFNPYSVDDATSIIGAVIAADGHRLREEMSVKGRLVAQQYLPKNILPKWEEFFETRKGSVVKE